MSRKPLTIIIIIFFSFALLFGQNAVVDSITGLLNSHPQPDTIRVKLLNDLAAQLKGIQPARSLSLAEEANKLAHSINFLPGEGRAFRTIGSYYFQSGDYAAALQYFDSAQKIGIRIKDTITIAWAFNGKGTVFHSQSDYPRALQYYLQAVKLFELVGRENEAASIMGNAAVLYKEMGELNAALAYFEKGLKIHEQQDNQNEIARFLNNIGGIYSDQNKFREAEDAFDKSLALSEATGNKDMMALVLRNMLETEHTQGNYLLAFEHGFRSLNLYEELGETDGVSDVSYQLALVYLKVNKPDSALFYAKKALSIAQETGFKRNIYNTYNVLGMAYAAKKMYSQAYEAQQKYIAYKDTITGEDKQNLVASLKFQFDLDKKQSKIELLTKDNELRAQQANQQRLKFYGVVVALVFVALLSIILGRSNRQRQKANFMLQQRNREIERQSAETEAALTELKAAQAQLIQSEKMASLGALTAGIAHEIQNPLNFVNNFSEVNGELISELVDEVDKGNAEEVKTIAEDIKQNLEKISHHGKRADSIVKGMLQHSRASTGQKELTDVNKLADEYLRLSYHGMRAKDKSFNAEFNTEFDERIGKINVVPQDIGRVLLNVINNAFYAVNEKKKNPEGSQPNESNLYVPTVAIVTKKLNDKIEIIVKDNGNGIPQDIVNKIFQPFFTTKPTGQGTGLGLSLAYDIIKANGGEIKVETKEGEGSEFIVQLPLNL